MKIRLTEEEAIQIKTACKKAREKGPCQQESQPGLLARWQQPYQLSFNLIVVWSAPTPEEPNTAEVPVIWGISEVEQGSPPTVRSVGNQEEVGEWEKSDNSGTKFDYGDGYFNDETGGSLQRHTTRGLWFLMECTNHINYLAAMFTVKSFAKDSRDTHVTSTQQWTIEQQHSMSTVWRGHTPLWWADLQPSCGIGVRKETP